LQWILPHEKPGLLELGQFYQHNLAFPPNNLSANSVVEF
jgi:hypothetical protein